MSKRNLKYNPHRARVPLDATNAGPYLKLAAGVVLFVAFLLLVALVLVPAMIRALKNGITWEVAPAETSVSAPLPQDALADRAAILLSFDPALAISAVIDPSVYAGDLLFVTGADTNVPTRLLRCDLSDGAIAEIPITIAHDAVRMPKENGRFLVYFDQRGEGGGSVRVIDKVLTRDTLLCDVHFGVPQLFLEERYLVFTERTDLHAYRVNAFDLYTMEAVTVALLADDAYGVSLPSLASGQVIFAEAAAKNAAKSVISSLRLDTGTPFTFDPGTFVHDPKSNGNCWAWMTGNHDKSSALYLSREGGTPMLIARGIADFYILPTAIIFCRDETVYAYAFSDERTYVLSEAGVKAQLLTAMNGYVIWRDVTDPEHITYKFLKAE